MKLTKDQAHRIVHSYVQGWEDGNRDAILRDLAEDCAIVEAHGISHVGLVVIEPWLDNWLATGSRMDNWHINNFYFDRDEQTAFFTWKFTSTYEGAQDSSQGTSMVQFEGDKMILIKGYQEAKS
jgi:hypothetical protein